MQESDRCCIFFTSTGECCFFFCFGDDCGSFFSLFFPKGVGYNCLKMNERLGYTGREAEIVIARMKW